ncbi:MAG: ABC transporter ATP-binding protein/permease [Bdellovibrionaceae bacterium]|nr:ABC transporter ATP-binding protein/permease [Pseudobdellovibrionaceae bacterium]
MNTASPAAKEKLQIGLALHNLVTGLWPFVKRYPRLLFVALLFTLLHLLGQRLLPVTLGQLVDKGITLKDENAFVFWASLYAGLQLSFFISGFLYSWFFASLGNQAVRDLRYQLLCKVLHLPLSYFNKTPTGRLVNRLTYDSSQLQEIFSDGLIHLVVQALSVSFIVLSMLWISPTLTLLALLPIPLFIYLAISVTKQVRLCQRQSKEQMGLMSGFLTERLSAFKALLTLNIREDTKRQFQVLSEDYKNIQLKTIATSAWLHPIMNLATAFLIGGLLFFFAQGWGPQLSLGAMITLVLHATDLIPPLREILERYQQFQNSITSAERVFPILQETEEQNLKRPMENQSKSDETNNPPKLERREDNKTPSENSRPPHPLASPSPRELIVAKQLSFRYADTGPWILHNLSISLPRGSRIALVGRTGSGKSTFIQILQGFYPPTSGQLLLDGRNIQDWPLHELRRFVGVIAQDPFLFQASLRDNLKAFLDVTADKLHHILQITGIGDYFKKQGKDLDFAIAERGHNLSQGEKQLIAFVRLFLYDPAFLIFDEATSNLDSESEALLQQAWLKLSQNKTSLVIAHRLSTLAHCDHAYLMKQGQLTKIDPDTLSPEDFF